MSATGPEQVVRSDIGQERESPRLIRIDKWLWQARFFKSRALATELVTAGRVRVNGQAVAKPSRSVGPGDVLTFPQAGDIRVVRVLDCGARRGPAVEAQALYENIVTEGPVDLP